jgi:hypothetical protein
VDVLIIAPPEFYIKNLEGKPNARVAQSTTIFSNSVCEGDSA